jgi:hypothetical protein
MKEKEQESKCWTCKHGYCIRQTTIEILRTETPAAEKDDFDFFDSNPASTIDDVQEIIKEGIYGLCYWAAKTFDATIPPMAVHIVRNCNRYEKDVK